MFEGKFLESILKNPAYTEKISRIDSSFYMFLQECFICDLIDMYNSNNAYCEVTSKQATQKYYEILTKYSSILNNNLLQNVPSLNQPSYRIKNRNIFSSNANNSDGLRNRNELTSEDKNGTILYRLANNIISDNKDKTLSGYLNYIDKYPYLYNFRSFFADENTECRCGNTENLFIATFDIGEKIPLPISGDFIYLCDRCLISFKGSGLTSIINKNWRKKTCQL